MNVRTMAGARALARKRGWRIEQRGSGHLAWFPPDGGRFVITSSTPSDHRAVLNALADLRRAGLR